MASRINRFFDALQILGVERLCYLPYLQQMIACEKQLNARVR